MPNNRLKRFANCAFFELPTAGFPEPAVGKRLRMFRDPAGLFVLRKIAEGLAVEGYRVGEARPAFGIEAGLRCYFTKGLGVDLCLGVSRRDSILSCDLLSQFFTPLIYRLLGGASDLKGDLPDRWRRFSYTIEGVVNKLGACSVTWLTDEEAAARWKNETNVSF